MSLPSHRISAEAFAMLASGDGGAAVSELCAAQASKHRLLVRFLVDESQRVGHPHAGLTARAYESLSELESNSPEILDACLRHPAVGAWALRTSRALAQGGGEPGRLAAIALAAAARAGVACRLSVPLRSELMLPSVGRLTLPTGAPAVTEVTAEPVDGGAELRLGDRTYRIGLERDAPSWQVLHRVSPAGGPVMTIDDLDPHRWPGSDVDSRLTDERRRHWTSCLHEGWRILASDHQTVAAETAAVVRALTPVVSRSHEGHSASARDTFGTIALTDPVDGLGMAVTLAHELEHAKLNALTEVVSLLGPDDGRLYYAPWRRDPRPLFGLLHGAYAHAGVAGFWRRHVDDPVIGPRAQVEFARWRHGAHLVTGTLLDSGGLTRAGTEFVGLLRDRLGRWLAEPVTPDAAARARTESERHRQEWARANA